jgi:hypothetical protein
MCDFFLVGMARWVCVCGVATGGFGGLLLDTPSSPHDLTIRWRERGHGNSLLRCCLLLHRSLEPRVEAREAEGRP